MTMHIEEVLTTPTTKTQVFVDLDGVLADFAKGVTKIFPEFKEGAGETNRKMDGRMWAAITNYQKRGGQFWFDLEPMTDAYMLWNYVKKYNPQILSATGQKRMNADSQKREWVSDHFGSGVVVNLTERAIEKAKYASPGAILIDDKSKAINPWVAAGGVGILHTSAANSIAQLQKLGL